MKYKTASSFTAILMAFLFSFLMLGCSSVATKPVDPNAPVVVNPAPPDTLLLQAAIGTPLYLVMKNNPKYVPSVKVIVAEMDQVIGTENVILTPEYIKGFLAVIAAKKNVDPFIAMQLSNAVTAGIEFFAQKYSIPAVGVPLSDPRAKAVVLAIRNGLNDAATAVSALPKPSA